MIKLHNAPVMLRGGSPVPADETASRSATIADRILKAHDKWYVSFFALKWWIPQIVLRQLLLKQLLLLLQQQRNDLHK